MPRIFRTLLFLSLVLSACTPGGLFPQAVSPAPATNAPTSANDFPTTEILPVIIAQVTHPPTLIATVSTPHVDQGTDEANTAVPSYPEGCGYQWAYQDTPELSVDFLQSLQALQPEAQGNAFAFGENCLNGDGSIRRFIPMETDFNITLQVNDIADESELGEWIVKVMRIIDDIPPEQIIGPRPGRVSLGFQASGQQEHISFYIDQYHGLSPGLSTAEIYRALKTQ